MRAVADGDLELSPRTPDGADRRVRPARRELPRDDRQLAELDKLKAEFVSVASHELKTPINVMIGYLQLLEDGIYGQLTPSSRTCTRRSVAAGEHAAAPREAAARREPLRGGRRTARAARRSKSTTCSTTRARVPRARGAARDRVPRRSARRRARRGRSGISIGSTRCSATCCRTRSSSRRAAVTVELIAPARRRIGVRMSDPRHRRRHSAGAASSHLRQVLSGRQSALGAARRNRLGTCHRQADRRGARRNDHVREQARCGNDDSRSRCRRAWRVARPSQQPRGARAR